MKFYAPIKLSENIRETPEGYLLCLGVPITRTGELVYLAGEVPIEPGDDGKIIIERHEEDVFDPISMASCEGKPFTVTHPVEFVKPENWADLARGNLHNLRRGEGDEKECLLSDILVTDPIGISLIKAGQREVSCGYDADYIQLAKGRGRQKAIIYNHAALVEKGRAGTKCAIGDSQNGRKNKMPKLKEKFLEVFTKKAAATFDEAMAEAESAEGSKSEDEGAKVYDKMMTMMKDMQGEIDKLKPQSDAAVAAPAVAAVKKDEVVADDAEVAPSLESRLDALEASVTKLLGAMSTEAGDEFGEEEGEESEDAAESEEEEMMTSDEDTVSRAEILAPGLKKTKDIKVQALKAAYGTKDGKAVIDQLTGGRAPAYDSADKVNTLFIASSELMKAKRTETFSRSKSARAKDSIESPGKTMTAEELNKKNAEFYARKH